MNMKRLGCAGLVVLWVGMGFGQEADSEGLKLLFQARTTLAQKELDAAYQYYQGKVGRNPSDAEARYHLAQVDLYRCDGADLRKERKAAIADLDEAIGEVKQAVQLNEKSADAHSLLADLYGKRIALGSGFMAGAHYGPKVQSENKRAMELGPGNPRVLASIGRQYLETPVMFGGDVDKAIDDFREAIKADPQMDETYVWLALAYRKKGDEADAKKAIDEALQRNPRSVFAQNVRSAK